MLRVLVGLCQVAHVNVTLVTQLGSQSQSGIIQLRVCGRAQQVLKDRRGMRRQVTMCAEDRSAAIPKGTRPYCLVAETRQMVAVKFTCAPS